MKGLLLCMSLSRSGENHLIIHEGWPVQAHSHIALANKNVFHNITQFTVLCERLGGGFSDHWEEKP